MRLEKLVGDRFKETPSEYTINSHIFTLRGGYIKYVSSGIFSLNTPMKRIISKIEQIVREEMEAIEGQEVLFPVVMPASLWEESGRLDSVGKELLRLRDRNDNLMVLGMTHEEAAVQLVRDFGDSYSKYPFMIYQIQTKFRDEARPRGGLIRVREFTMKDAYSFHTSQEDLEEYYMRCFNSYLSIFSRVGLPNVIPILSDSGMMGGDVSHEFILLTPVGEDSIAICSECDYHANVEIAENIIENTVNQNSMELELVYTPNIQTIEEVCNFLDVPEEKTCKAIVYQKEISGEHVVLFLRGDMEASVTKVTNYLGENVVPAVLNEDSELHIGYIGPLNINEKYIVLFDKSLKNACDLVVGANQVGYHYTGLSMKRDCENIGFYDFSKIIDGGKCPNCMKNSIAISRGIEVGNIFQLGTKYTKPMAMKYQDKDATMHNPVMGCYGIGIGRLAAAICEAHHDEHGPMWPMTVAPWQVHICCLRADNQEIRAFADILYKKLLEEKIEVLYDDRIVSAGIMFADADLLGVPLRIIVSPKNTKDECYEINSRDGSFSIKVDASKAVSTIKSLIEEQLKHL